MFSPSTTPGMLFAGALLTVSLGGCTESEPTIGEWEATGELVALSGGDAGARGACMTCHGLTGEGDGRLVPRLAGLNAGYIARQLEYFSTGLRQHPQMSWIAERLEWQARQNVAFHYAQLPVPEDIPRLAEDLPLPEGACSLHIARLYQAGDPERDIPACASCHGIDGMGVGQGSPPLAAQPAPYLAAQLEHWRSGERYGDALGVMNHVSRSLDEEEIAPLAVYASHLRDSSSNPALPEACLRTRRPDPRSGA